MIERRWQHTARSLGQLSAVANSTKSTTAGYVYDADGHLLLQTDPTGTTLYLPDQQLTQAAGTGTVTAVRYYQLTADITAVRTGTGNAYDFEVGNQQNTGMLYLDYTAQVPTWRQYDPYGNLRGNAPAWIDNRGFLDDPNDTATTLTDIGARWYDPSTGRFASLDPVYEANDPLALGGYSYTDGNPLTFQDPTGDCVKVDGGDGPCATALTSKNPTVRQSADKMLQQQDAMDANAQQSLYINSHNVVTTKPSWYSPGGKGYNTSKGTSSASSGSSFLEGIVHHIVQYGRDVVAAPELSSTTNEAIGTSSGSSGVFGCGGVFQSMCGAFDGIKHGAEDFGRSLWNHVSSGATVCFVVCLGLSTGGGHHLSFTVGALGFGGWSGGTTAADESDTGPWGFGVSGGFEEYGGIAGGIRSTGNPDGSNQVWGGVTGGLGAGFFVGATYTWYLF